jgi:hypothetical protein
MKALPDIRTANKVVELVLKNASIAVTGIWQADDDGVLNPATIRLVPGTIIPKAVGSSGLTPLAAPGRFDVSQIVLDDLRARIRHALLADRLGRDFNMELLGAGSSIRDLDLVCALGRHRLCHGTILRQFERRAGLGGAPTTSVHALPLPGRKWKDTRSAPQFHARTQHHLYVL